MSTQKDIAQLPSDVKDFLRRNGIRLNPLVWHSTYRYPEDTGKFKPERTHRRFFLLKTAMGFEFLTQHSSHKKGTVYEIRLSEGIGGPKPAAPLVELVRGKISEPSNDPLPGTSGVDQEVGPKYHAQLRFTYEDGTGVKAPYTILAGQETFEGQLAQGKSVRHRLSGPGTVSYSVGSRVSDEQWHSELGRLQSACDGLRGELNRSSGIRAIPTRAQNFHLIHSGVLEAGNPAQMPTALFSDGYPLGELFRVAAQAWESKHHRPDCFRAAFRKACSITASDLKTHLGQTLGLMPQGLITGVSPLPCST